MRLPCSRILESTLCLSLLLLAACTVSKGPIGNPEAPYPPAQAPEIGEIYHLPTGTRVTTDQMLRVLTDNRVVFIGETHDNPAAHRLELEVLAAMADRYPEQVSLGMEMFHVEQQEVLDMWVAGQLDEKSFLKQVDWFGNWGMDFAYYRDILTYARDHRIPIVALNAPKTLVKAVSMQPPAELEPDLQAQLPDMDLDDPYQRTLTEAVFAGHGPGESMLDGFHRAQTLWDEMMAENVARHLRAKGSGQRMVVMAGGNHVRYGFGIPRRVYRRLPVSYRLVGVHEIGASAEKQGRTMDIDMPQFPMVPYDYVRYVAYESLPGERVKLGVRYEEAHGRILIKAVVPGSAAAEAGLQPGDYLEFLGRKPVNDSFDLVYEVGQRRTGDEIEVIIDRDGQPLALKVTFIPLPLPEGHGQHGSKD